MHAADRGTMEGLRVAELPISDVHAFKCVGDQAFIGEYVAAHPPRVIGDWSALYMQFDILHALGTVGYRWDQGYSFARVIRATLPEMLAVVVDAPWMPDGSVGGEAKAEAVRKALRLPADVPLMQAVGEQGKVLICRETEQQWELVVPSQLASTLAWQQEAACELKPNKYGATGEWRRRGSEMEEVWSDWQRFHDSEALAEVEPPSWIEVALSELSG